MSAPFKEYLFEYEHDGATWCITVMAADAADAQARMQRMSLARYCGEIAISVPVMPRWLSRLFGFERHRSTPAAVPEGK